MVRIQFHNHVEPSCCGTQPEPFSRMSIRVDCGLRRCCISEGLCAIIEQQRDFDPCLQCQLCHKKTVKSCSLLRVGCIQCPNGVVNVLVVCMSEDSSSNGHRARWHLKLNANSQPQNCTPSLRRAMSRVVSKPYATQVSAQLFGSAPHIQSRQEHCSKPFCQYADSTHRTCSSCPPLSASCLRLATYYCICQA